MTPLDFLLMFGLGLAGSVHCVQMCGPIVLSFSLTSRNAAAHAAYHGGRLLTYSALGAAGGALGAGFTILAAIQGIQNGAAITAGAVMIAAGLLLGKVASGPSLIQIGAAPGLARKAGMLLRSPALPAKFVTGALLGFLPCGLIYAALLKAIATATPLGGALTMLAFGMGTAGPLIGLGAFSTVLTSRFRSQKLAAAGIALMGVFLIWRGLMPVGAVDHLHHH